MNVSVRTRAARTSSSSINPGSRTEAAQNGNRLRGRPPAAALNGYERSRPTILNARARRQAPTGWDRTVADDVLAPSARQHTDAGAAAVPIKIERSASAPALPRSLTSPRGSAREAETACLRSPRCHPRACPEDPRLSELRLDQLGKRSPQAFGTGASGGLGPRDKPEGDREEDTVCVRE